MRRHTPSALVYRTISLLWLLGVVALPPLAAEDRDEWQQPDRVVADVGLTPGMAIADIGCGTGYFAFRLAKVVGDTGTVFAVDISQEALDAVSDRVRAESWANARVVRSEPTDTTLPPGSLDAAFVCDVFHEMPEDQRLPLARSIVESLKPGGLFYLIDYRKSHDVTFDPYEELIPREDLVALGESAGCVLDAEYHYLKYQVFLRFRKPVVP